MIPKGAYIVKPGMIKVETYHPNCNSTIDLKDMILKMGGLLCPNCRIILFYPNTIEFKTELKRRKE